MPRTATVAHLKVLRVSILILGPVGECERSSVPGRREMISSHRLQPQPRPAAVHPLVSGGGLNVEGIGI